MSKTSVRLPVVASVVIILLVAIIICNAPAADSHSNGGDSRASEQVSSTETSATSSVGYGSQQSAKSGDYIFALASHRFEPLLLLLLGSTLLFIGSGIRLLLSRRLRRNPELLKNDK